MRHQWLIEDGENRYHSDEEQFEHARLTVGVNIIVSTARVTIFTVN